MQDLHLAGIAHLSPGQLSLDFLDFAAEGVGLVLGLLELTLLGPVFLLRGLQATAGRLHFGGVGQLLFQPEKGLLDGFQFPVQLLQLIEVVDEGHTTLLQALPAWGLSVISGQERVHIP